MGTNNTEGSNTTDQTETSQVVKKDTPDALVESSIKKDGKVKITLNDPQGDGKVYGQYDPGSGDTKIGGSTGDIAKGPLKGIDLGASVAIEDGNLTEVEFTAGGKTCLGDAKVAYSYAQDPETGSTESEASLEVYKSFLPPRLPLQIKPGGKVSHSKKAYIDDDGNRHEVEEFDVSLGLRGDAAYGALDFAEEAIGISIESDKKFIGKSDYSDSVDYSIDFRTDSCNVVDPDGSLWPHDLGYDDDPDGYYSPPEYIELQIAYNEFKIQQAEKQIGGLEKHLKPNSTDTGDLISTQANQLKIDELKADIAQMTAKNAVLGEELISSRDDNVHFSKTVSPDDNGFIIVQKTVYQADISIDAITEKLGKLSHEINEYEKCVASDGHLYGGKEALGEIVQQFRTEQSALEDQKARLEQQRDAANQRIAQASALESPEAQFNHYIDHHQNAFNVVSRENSYTPPPGMSGNNQETSANPFIQYKEGYQAGFNVVAPESASSLPPEPVDNDTAHAQFHGFDESTRETDNPGIAGTESEHNPWGVVDNDTQAATAWAGDVAAAQSDTQAQDNSLQDDDQTLAAYQAQGLAGAVNSLGSLGNIIQCHDMGLASEAQVAGAALGLALEFDNAADSLAADGDTLLSGSATDMAGVAASGLDLYNALESGDGWQIAGASVDLLKDIDTCLNHLAVQGIDTASLASPEAYQEAMSNAADGAFMSDTAVAGLGAVASAVSLAMSVEHLDDAIDSGETWEIIGAGAQTASAAVNTYHAIQALSALNSAGSAVAGTAAGATAASATGAAANSIPVVGAAMAAIGGLASIAQGDDYGGATGMATAVLMCAGPYGWIAAAVFSVVTSVCRPDPPPLTSEITFAYDENGDLGMNTSGDDEVAEAAQSYGDALLEMAQALEESGVDIDINGLPEIRMKFGEDYTRADINYTGVESDQPMGLFCDGSEVMRAFKDVLVSRDLLQTYLTAKAAATGPDGEVNIDQLGSLLSASGIRLNSDGSFSSNFVDVMDRSIHGTGIRVGGGNVTAEREQVVIRAGDVTSLSSNPSATPPIQMQTITQATSLKGNFRESSAGLMAVALAAGGLAATGAVQAAAAMQADPWEGYQRPQTLADNDTSLPETTIQDPPASAEETVAFDGQPPPFPDDYPELEAYIKQNWDLLTVRYQAGHPVNPDGSSMLARQLSDTLPAENSGFRAAAPHQQNPAPAGQIPGDDSGDDFIPHFRPVRAAAQGTPGETRASSGPSQTVHADESPQPPAPTAQPQVFPPPAEIVGAVFDMQEDTLLTLDLDGLVSAGQTYARQAAADDTPAGDPSAPTPDEGSTPLAEPATDPVWTSVTVTGGVNGEVYLENGAIQFKPEADFFGQASFDYTLTNESGETLTRRAQVRVGNVNDAPTPLNGVMEFQEDTPVALTPELVSQFVSDVENDTLALENIRNITGGRIEFIDGTPVFIPDENYYGAASFDYTVNDGQDANNLAEGHLNIDIGAVNDLPQAATDSGQTLEETAITFSQEQLLANDWDIEDGDQVHFAGLNGALNGHVAWGADGLIHFTPEKDFAGTAWFQYQAADTQGGLGDGLVRVDVANVNDAPVAADDAKILAWGNGTYENVYDPGVFLANDYDVDGDALTITAVGDAAQGRVWLDNDGNIRFASAHDQVGPDHFTYTVSDGQGGSAQARANITVAMNHSPDPASEQLASLEEDHTARIDPALLLANDSDGDGDGLFIQSVGAAEHGTVTMENGQILFTPAPDYNGPASFEYTVTDGVSEPVATRAFVNVTPVNDAPTVRAETITGVMEDDHDVQIDPALLLQNDSDLEGDEFSLTGVTKTGRGDVWQDSEGTIHYRPGRDFNGEDNFSYQVQDTHGAVRTGTAYVRVEAVNDRPVVEFDRSSGNAGIDNTYAISKLLGNDSDIDGDRLSISRIIDDGSGRARISGDTLHYTTDETGSATIRYMVSDGHGGETESQLFLSIAPPPNQAPVFSDKVTAYTINQGSSSGKLVFDFDAHDLDGPDTDLRYTLVGRPNSIGFTEIEYETGKVIISGSTSHIMPNGDTVYYFPEVKYLKIQVSDNAGKGAVTIKTFTELPDFSKIVKWAKTHNKPVVLDLDQDGLELAAISAGAAFDWNGDGKAEASGWVKPDDALLAYDHDGDGEITQADEISFVDYLPGAQTDLEGLQHFDTNQNNHLDKGDAAWSQFGVWQDKNMDGVTDEGEFLTLDDAGIADIGLASDGDQRLEAGNTVYGESTYTREDGTTGIVGDVGFEAEGAVAEGTAEAPPDQPSQDKSGDRPQTDRPDSPVAGSTPAPATSEPPDEAAGDEIDPETASEISADDPIADSDLSEGDTDAHPDTAGNDTGETALGADDADVPDDEAATGAEPDAGTTDNPPDTAGSGTGQSAPGPDDSEIPEPAPTEPAEQPDAGDSPPIPPPADDPSDDEIAKIAAQISSDAAANFDTPGASVAYIPPVDVPGEDSMDGPADGDQLFAV